MTPRYTETQLWYNKLLGIGEVNEEITDNGDALMSISERFRTDKADTSIDDILATSGTLVTKINYGIQGIAGAEYYAQLGGIAPTDFLLTDGVITEQERIAYMDALSVVQGSTYYDAGLLLQTMKMMRGKTLLVP